jgi:protein SCO1
MSDVMKWVLAMAVCVFLASAGALLLVSGMRGGSRGDAAGQRSADPLTPDENVEDLSIPAFELVSQDGETVTNEAFEGNVTVVDFVFTNCPLVCPIMTGTLADLSERLEGTGVRFLSISVDPDRDTPERLKEFGGKYGADFSRWTFARGEKDATWKIVREGLMFAIEDDESLPITLADGSTMLNIRHPSHYVLVGPDGRVLGLYSSTDEERVRELEARARAAASAVRRG